VTMNRLNWLAFAVVLGMVLAALAFAARLPDPVPTHWNMAGEVDGWTPKPWGVWLFPALAAGLLALFQMLPVISPRGFRLEAGRRAYDIVVFAVLAFLAAVQVLVYLVALGRGPGVEKAVPLLIGFLFIVLGNYLGKFPKNFFVGIRTPWTLASDEVWNRTHRLAGWTFMLAGLVMLASVFIPSTRGLMIAAIAVAAGVPVVYSLWLYRKLHGFEADKE